MKQLFIISFLLSSFILQAQDKLIYKNGGVRKGQLISVSKELVYFRQSDSSATEQILRSDLLLAETAEGTRYIFAPGGEPDKKTDPSKMRRNSLTVQPLGIFVGRATFVYERLSDDEKIGFAVPLSLTFDPFGPIYQTGIDTGFAAIRRITGVNFITGMDVNFYLSKKEFSRFFIGPRFRYGTDVFLREVEAYTLQTQMGWRFGRSSEKIVQTLAMGFGFVKIVSSPQGTLLDPRQAYGWFSFTYRAGFSW